MTVIIAEGFDFFGAPNDGKPLPSTSARAAALLHLARCERLSGDVIGCRETIARIREMHESGRLPQQ